MLEIMEATGTECIRADAISSIVADILALEESMFIEAREIAQKLAKLTEAELATLDGIIKHDSRIKWKELYLRISACAYRGIINAEHLYGTVRVIHPHQILNASKVALRAIADPDADFPVVDSRGKARIIRAGDLTYTDASVAWHYKTGIVSVGNQRKKLISRIEAPVPSKSARVFRITRCSTVDCDGSAMIECEVSDTNGNTQEMLFSAREIRKLVKIGGIK